MRKKRSAAQIRATRKLVAFNKARRSGRGTKARRRKTTGRKATGTVRIKVRARRRRNPLQALIANPSYGYTRAFADGYEKAFGKARKRRKTKGPKPMAKRRRKRASSRKASPRRRRRAGGRTKSIRLRGRRKARLTVYANPRRRRRRRGAARRRVSRRRNPSFGGGGSLIKRTFTAYAAGFITSGIAALIDKQLSNKSPTIARVAKIALAFGIAKFGRKHAMASASAIGALAASEGYNLATKLLGGMGAAATPEQAIKGIAEMSDSYPEMGALLDGGVGALLNGVPNVNESATDYGYALNNMADSDD